MRETRRSRIAPLLIATACGPIVGEPQSDGASSTGVVASASASTSETMPAGTSSSGAIDESTGAAMPCRGGGPFDQIVARHWIDLSAWPSDGDAWWLDTDCTFVELTSTDVANWRFACLSPLEPAQELVLELSCFFTSCDLATLTPGESVHLVTQLSTTSGIWTVLRDEEDEILFIGVSARTVEPPGGYAITTPLYFERAPPGSCEPTGGCGDEEPTPIIVGSGRDSALVYDSSVSTIDVGGARYDVSVETSCAGLDDPDGYFANLVLFPSPDLVH